MSEFSVNDIEQQFDLKREGDWLEGRKSRVSCNDKYLDAEIVVKKSLFQMMEACLEHYLKEARILYVQPIHLYCDIMHV